MCNALCLLGNEALIRMMLDFKKSPRRQQATSAIQDGLNA